MEIHCLKCISEIFALVVARVIKEHATGISLDNNAEDGLCLEFRHRRRRQSDSGGTVVYGYKLYRLISSNIFPLLFISVLQFSRSTSFVTGRNVSLAFPWVAPTEL